VGNIRTALFTWLFARHHRGSFIIRVEDTDVARKVEGAVEAILDSLRWLGLDWDEGPEVGGDYGPYFQSERLDLYRSYMQQLLDTGRAYKCYCTSERLTQMRTEMARRNESQRSYDRYCRYLSADEQVERETQGLASVIRFKIEPLEGQTTFHDLIRGDITFDNSELDDIVLLKSDGYPTYHLANIVDDHLMKISHVIRADEWLSSSPRHVLLYQTFGWEPPLFAHLPMILSPDKSKMSKRHGAVSITEYREQGFLPEAMINFLALLGWSLDDRTEILSRQDLIDNFSLERVSRTAAIFNREKLDWMNGLYIRSLSREEFTQRVLPFLERDLLPEVKRPLATDYIQRIMPLIQERARTLADVSELAEFFFVDKLEYEKRLLIGKGMSQESATRALEVARQRLGQLARFDAETLEVLLRPLAVKLGLKTGQLFGTLRVATTGRTAAPPLFQTMAVLGKERCLKRIRVAVGKLGNKLRFA
jgi:glutamyl-tRNA synthetase